MSTVFATTSHQNQTQPSSGSKPSAEIVDGESGFFPTLCFFGARDAKGCGNSEGGQGASLLGSLGALGSLGVRESAKGDGNSEGGQGATGLRVIKGY